MVRISHAVAVSPGYRLGPVVMTFPQTSTTQPVWIYGDGYLWLYEPTTHHGSELLRVSLTTGAILQRMSMPQIPRPILAVNNEGLWIAPAVNSTGTAVYHVAIGASAAVPAFRLQRAEYAAWMVAAGHSVWLEVSSGGKAGTLWHLVGKRAVRIPRVTLGLLGNLVEVQGGPATMVGNSAVGLWTVVPTSSGTKQRVFRIDPDSGALKHVASIKPSYANANDVLYGPWHAVTLNGSMYVLDPPVATGTYPYRLMGFSALYRIAPLARPTGGAIEAFSLSTGTH